MGRTGTSGVLDLRGYPSLFHQQQRMRSPQMRICPDGCGWGIILGALWGPLLAPDLHCAATWLGTFWEPLGEFSPVLTQPGPEG